MAAYTTQIQGWLFASEGGYVNHPRDPGGATNHGVTHRVLAAWRGVSEVTRDDVRNMPKSEAAAIMKANYWDRIFGDALPAGLDYATLDYAVNSGVSKAVKDLQRCLSNYTGRVDGIMGQLTLDAIRKTNDLIGLIHALCNRRYAFVKSLRTFDAFGKGWTRRIMGNVIGAQPGRDIGVIDRASYLANGTPPENLPAPETAQGKANPEQETVLDALKKPEMIGVAVSGAGGVFAATADNPILSVALAIVIVGAAGLAAFYFINRMRAADPA